MTLAAFDPSLLSNYDQPKYLLHFQWKNSDTKVYRYALVEEIDITKLDDRLKTKQDEVGLTQQEIWEKKYKWRIYLLHTHSNIIRK